MKGVTGLERWVLGSVSETVAREAECSVVIARPRTYADVDLAKIVDVVPHLTYVPPHRYTYEHPNLSMPEQWPPL